LERHIPDIKVEEIKNRSNIVDLVAEYVTLKKTGRNYVGLCPFHKEKTPSFTVTPDRQMFYCFGCGEGGGIFNFLMKISQMTYPEAVRHLARKTGVVLPERSTPLQRQADSRREQLIRINEMAAGHYIGNLFSASGKEALDYLQRRGIRLEIVKAFRLGFALNSWHNLRDFFEKEKVSLTNALQVGLLIPGKDASPYDRFRGRLMFPLEDLSGRVIAFGGRIIDVGEPKYLNSPESDVYVKGRTLYGINRAKEAIRRQGYAIVVEGYFDLISLWNADITNVVATMGTALTKEQIELIGRYTTQVVVLFDPDEAGRKALERSLESFLTGNLSGRALVLPEGLDPDDYIRTYGGDSLMELIARAPSFADYYIDHVLGGQSGFEAGRDSFHRAAAFIRQIENVIERNLFIKRVSERLGIDQELLKKEISHNLNSNPDEAAVKGGLTVEIEKIEMDLVYLFLIHPERIATLRQTNCLDYFTNVELKQLGQDLWAAVAGPGPADVVETINRMNPGPVREGLMKKLVSEDPVMEEKSLDRMLFDAIMQIKRRWYKQKYKVLMVRLKKAQEAGDGDLCNHLLSEQNRLMKEARRQGV
jgi:DNA primase